MIIMKNDWKFLRCSNLRCTCTFAHLRLQNAIIPLHQFGSVRFGSSAHCAVVFLVPFCEKDWFRYRTTVCIVSHPMVYRILSNAYGQLKHFILHCIALHCIHIAFVCFYDLFKCRRSDLFTACILFGCCVSILFVNLNMTSALYTRCLFY